VTSVHNRYKLQRNDVKGERIHERNKSRGACARRHSKFEYSKFVQYILYSLSDYICFIFEDMNKMKDVSRKELFK